MKTVALLFLAVIIFSCNSKSTQDSDLVAYWSFDLVSATIVPDESANQLNAINKGALPVEGKVGKALEFDGKSVLQIDYKPIFDDFRNGITVSAWIKKDSASYWNTVVSREIGDGWSEYIGLAVYQNKPLFSVDPDGKNYINVQSNELLLPDIWYHLAGTFGNDTFKLYLNGTMINSGICKSAWHFNDQNPLLVGGNSNNQNQSLVDCFKGSIDEVRIYKRALTTKEINNLINN